MGKFIYDPKMKKNVKKVYTSSKIQFHPSLVSAKMKTETDKWWGLKANRGLGCIHASSMGWNGVELLIPWGPSSALGPGPMGLWALGHKIWKIENHKKDFRLRKKSTDLPEHADRSVSSSYYD